MITTAKQKPLDRLNPKTPFKMITTKSINVVPKIIKPPIQEGKKPFMSTNIMDPEKLTRMEKYAQVMEEKKAFRAMNEPLKLSGGDSSLAQEKQKVKDRMAKARAARGKK